MTSGDRDLPSNPTKASTPAAPGGAVGDGGAGAARGVMAALVREHDWARTPLGPMQTWPQALRVAVGICLNSRFPMFVWWGPHLINIYNDAYIPILGKRHPDALGRPARESWEEIWSVVGPQADAVMQRGEATWNERVLLMMERHGFAEETYFTWSYSPIPDERGGIGGLFCACTEDTGRVMTERERDRLAGQRQLALNAARMGWWHYDPVTKVATWDERYAEIFGVSGNRSPNDEILKRLHPDDLPGVWAAVEAALDPVNPKPYSAEYRVMRDDGEVRWVEAHGLANFAGEGAERRAVSFVGTVADVTERKLAEEQPRTILESITDAFFALDRQWRFTYLNRQAQRVLGRAPGELIGKVIWEVYPGLPGSEFETAYRRAATERVAVSCTAFYPDHDRWYEVHAYPVPDGISVYFRDASNRKRAEAERENLLAQARAQNERTSEILESISDAFYAVDKDFRFTYVNHKAEELWGRRREELIGRHFWTEFPRAVGSESYRMHQLVMTERRPVRYETVSPLIGRWVEVSLYPEAGGGLSCYFHDISDRRQSQEALRESEARLNAILNNAPAMVYVVDSQHQFRFINRRWAAVFNLTNEQAAGRSIFDFFPKDVADQFAANNQVVLADGKPHESEEVVPHPDGLHTYISVKVPLLDGEGRAYAICGISTDITDRKRAENALRESTERLRLAVAIAQMGTFDIDLLTDAVTVNDPGRDIYGWKPGEALTFAKVQTHFHPDDRDWVVQRVADALRPNGPGEFEVEQRIIRRDGAVRWIRVRGRAVFEGVGDGAGRRAVRCAGTYLDITEQREAEQQRERLLLAERAARAEAERASEAKSEFLATLSHELRTPLTPVLLTVSLMESNPALPPELREDVATIRRNVELESRLISDLLDLTRVSKGKLQLDMQDVDLHLIVRSAIDICQREASAKMVVELRAARQLVRGDSTRLQQIFWNLINNAQKFTGPEGIVTVRSTDAPDGRIRVEISDTGVGIDPAVLPRLFNAFEQGEVRAAQQQAGLGLGLAISKKLATAHGGTITASSAGRGRGATFTVELPAVAVFIPDAASPPQSRRLAPVAEPLNVLIVEDHEPTLRVMVRLLKHLGHNVTGVMTVAAATAAARQDGFHVIISDLGLPDGSGLDVMRQLKDRYAGRAIALTGYGMDADIAASREAGFAEHLIKPVDVQALDAAIRRLKTTA